MQNRVITAALFLGGLKQYTCRISDERLYKQVQQSKPYLTGRALYFYVKRMTKMRLAFSLVVTQAPP
jgi:hypothetical protein